MAANYAPSDVNRLLNASIPRFKCLLTSLLTLNHSRRFEVEVFMNFIACYRRDPSSPSGFELMPIGGIAASLSSTGSSATEFGEAVIFLSQPTLWPSENSWIYEEIGWHQPSPPTSPRLSKIVTNEMLAIKSGRPFRTMPTKANWWAKQVGVWRLVFMRGTRLCGLRVQRRDRRRKGIGHYGYSHRGL